MTSVAPIANDQDFTDESPAASDKVDASVLDSQLAAVKNKINALLAALGLVIRDDDTLVDEVVRLRNLHSEILTAIAANDAWLPKLSVDVATTANITLSGEQTIDGVLTSASRVLVKNQTTAAQNGIYVSAAGAWARATDADTADEIGLACTLVLGGTQQSNTAWVQNVVASAITIGTTSLVWAQYAGPAGTTPTGRGGTGQTSIAAWPTNYRRPVRVAATAAITISGPGASIDGIAMSAGDRVLLTGQVTGSQNGLWQWNGAAVAMTRPVDYPGSSTVHAYQDIVVQAREGTTRGGTIWRLSTAGAITIDSTSTAWLEITPLAQSAGGSGARTLGAGTVTTTGGTFARAVADHFHDVISAKDFHALGDGATNDQPALQAALDYLNSVGGGTLLIPPGDYRLSAPLTTYDQIRIIGAGREATKLTKTTSTVVAASATDLLVCLDGAAMGDVSGDVNCVIWLYDSVRVLNPEIAHLTIRSTGTAATTAPVEFGIASSVGFSDGMLHDLAFEYFSRASIALGDCFFAELFQIKSYRCGQGISIEAGTSMSIRDCYAIYCQKYGLFLRDVSYTVVQNHACDGLNNVSNASDYTDRTVNSRAYVLNACKGVTMMSCGAEQCFGTQIYVYSCIQTAVRNCRLISPASSFTGTGQVALFYVDSTNQGVEITGNLVSRGGVTALQGAAVSGDHHDLYVDSVSNQGFHFRNNLLCNAVFDAPSAIYGNNVPTYVVPGVQSAEIAGEFSPTVTLTGATGVTLTYGAKNKGRVSLRDGWATYDITVHLATTAFTGGTLVQINGMPWNNAALNNARLLCDESSGVTWASTEGYWLEIDPGASNGLIRNRTATVALSVGAGAFASGATDVILHFAGRVYVGDTVSVK